MADPGPVPRLLILLLGFKLEFLSHSPNPSPLPALELIDEPGGIRDSYAPGCNVLDANVEPTISGLFGAAEQGDKAASQRLFGALYAELHRVAKYELARRAGCVSLSATTLLHEAYLAMSSRGEPTFPDRPRFMGYAARVMRRLIIDHARERQAQKRGGLFEITALDTNAMESAVNHVQLTEISDALDELSKVEPLLAEIIDLKFFCGLSFSEIGAMRDVSERTVQRNWERARLYLHRKLRADLLV